MVITISYYKGILPRKSPVKANKTLAMLFVQCFAVFRVRLFVRNLLRQGNADKSIKVKAFGTIFVHS